METPFEYRQAARFLRTLRVATGAATSLEDIRRGRSRSAPAATFLALAAKTAGAWRFLYQLFKHGNHPVAIITDSLPDPSVVQGAILAGIPILCEPERKLKDLIANGALVAVEVTGETGLIRFQTTD